ncbi:MAG: DUF1800 domain-containing protein [Pseudomonadota bacterium]
MSFTPERAAIRFGCGLSPRQAAPGSVDDMLSLLTGPDLAAEAFPIPGMDAIYQLALDDRTGRRALRAAKTNAEKKAAQKELRAERRRAKRFAAVWLGQTLMRRVQTADGFRERLMTFWADHFTARGKGPAISFAHTNYAQEAIRPHVAGRFSDLLRAAVTHPLMIHYLDQNASVATSSRVAKRNPDRGINENLARELLELHTLGVGGPYAQTDVRELAELLAGLSFSLKEGFVFRNKAASMRQHTVLGRRYGGNDRLQAIYRVLEDISVHPATARYIAQKLATHFIGDAPDQTLVDALEQRFAETDGDLMAVYETLLTHPGSWGESQGNVKQPIDFIGSSLRALDIHPRQMPGKNVRRVRRFFYGPLILMGQEWGRPAGPDGWPEADEQWITPQRLAARLQWAMSAPIALRKTLPDPREFVEIALGPLAPDEVRFAAGAAETRPEGVGVILSSAAFQRM